MTSISYDEKIPRQIDPCPKTPNCVSSLSEPPTFYIEPLQYTLSWPDARLALLAVLEGFKRVALVESGQNYIHAEFKSFLFRFVDDVQFLVDETAKCIHVRSASRVGYWDFGVNRKRVEKIRKQFYHVMEKNAKDL